MLSVREMSRADAAAVAAGVPGSALMAAAGAAVARGLRVRRPRGPVLVLCGPGNNGGDGYVAARLLRAEGWPVRVMALGRPKLGSDAARHAAAWSGPVEPADPRRIGSCRYVIDALFGAGLARPLDGAARRLVEAVNRRVEAGAAECLAVDVPSGIDGDTGAVRGVAPTAFLTVTFFRKKPAHLLVNSKEYMGEILLEQIGIPAAVLPRIGPRWFENGPALWLDQAPQPGPRDHKYTRGHLLVVAGPDMVGAARLAAMAARRAGAGLVTIGADRSALPALRAGEPGLLLAETATAAQIGAVLSARRRNAAVIGPGLGLGRDGGAAVRDKVLAVLAAGRPAVLDADALSAFHGRAAGLFRRIQAETVLTPHDGEFARLFGALPGSRLERASAASRRAGAVVVLKGADTVIAAPGGEAIIAGGAPADLATGGSGDVLAGLIGGLLAGGVPAFPAAALAVWLQAEAARRAGPGLIAEDIVGSLSPVLGRLRLLAVDGS